MAATLKALQKAYGKTPALFVQTIHRLYCSGKQTVKIEKLTNVKSGTYIYPYTYFRENLGFTDIHVSMVLKRLRDAELLLYVKIGGTPFYKLNYANQQIIDSGLEEPELLEAN